VSLSVRKVVWPIMAGCVAATLAVALPLPDHGTDDALPIPAMVITDGHAARWSACDISYAVNPDNAPKGAVEDFVAAAADITTATGVVFTRLPDTTVTFGRDVAADLTGDAGQPDMLITWAMPVGEGNGTYPESDLLDGEHTAAKTEIFTEYRQRFGVLAPSHKITGSTITFQATTRGAGGKGGQMSFALHELGHVMGLGHTQLRGSMMNPYGALDRTELSELDAFHLRTVSPPQCHTG
jgi:hypothetical protein